MDNPATEQRRLERAEKERKASIADRQEDLDLGLILGSIGGRRFLRKLLKTCKVNENIESATSSIVYQNLGKQAIGRELVKEMKAVSLENYFLLLKEGETEVKSKHLKGGTDGDQD